MPKFGRHLSGWTRLAIVLGPLDVVLSDHRVGAWYWLFGGHWGRDIVENAVLAVLMIVFYLIAFALAHWVVRGFSRSQTPDSKTHSGDSG